MTRTKAAVAALVTACALAIPGAASADLLSNECNSTTDGIAGPTGANGTVHGTGCRALP